MKQFIEAFKVAANTRILDVGGTQFNWALVGIRPAVMLVNLDMEVRPSVVGDACQLPFRDGAFDIVYSNSVIEHLGSRKAQDAFAAECRRCGASYYIQTPNKWFPIEPHWLTPFIHWLPLRARRVLARNFTVRGLLERPTPGWCEDMLNRTQLLSVREMRRLFPEAAIWREKVAWCTKSVIAAKIR